MPKEKGAVLVEGCDLWVKLEGPSHVLSNVTLDVVWMPHHWWRWCLCCVIRCHACPGEKRPQLHHQCASLDLMQLVKKHQATKPLMPDPQKRFQLDGHQPPRGHQPSRGYQLPIFFDSEFICLSKWACVLCEDILCKSGLRLKVESCLCCRDHFWG